MLDRRPWLVPTACVLIGAILRLGRFPHAGSPSQFDEISYLSNGLLLLEGETTINKYAPSGPLTWLSAAYGGVKALFKLIADKADIADFPTILRPAAALQSALFDLYTDLNGLRLTVVVLTILLTLAAVVAACRLGKALGGTPGQILAGLLAAGLPIFVEMSTETRPYASAWALALIALAAAGTGKSGTRVIGGGIFLGLAVGSHIDMIRVVPLVSLLQWRRAEPGRPPWDEFGRTMGVALIAFLLVAPWYTLHILDNIRQILSVRVLSSAEHGVQWFQAGLAIPLAIALIGLLAAGWRRRWPAFCASVWLGLNALLALRPSEHGLQHDGALIVMVVALAPLGVATIFELVPILRRFPVWVAAIAMIVTPCMWQGVMTAFADGRSLEPDQSIDWIEANIPAGTPVYVDSGQFRALLPTSRAADRLWADVASPFVWKEKYLHDMARFGLDDSDPLRVMSTDRLAADLGNRRRFYILGAAGQAERPRYDIWSVSYGSFFDLPPKAAIAQLCRDGGVYLHSGTAIPDLPAPAMSWVRRDGNSTFIYRIAAGGCGR
jgi:hypothetical protein